MGICKIIDGLYVGELSDAVNLRALDELDIDVVIDVRNNFQPLGDRIKFNITKLSGAISNMIDDDLNVFIYCRAGIDRSPFVAQTVVKWQHGCDWNEAWDVVSKGRPQAQRHLEWQDEWNDL